MSDGSDVERLAAALDRLAAADRKLIEALQLIMLAQWLEDHPERAAEVSAALDQAGS